MLWGWDVKKEIEAYAKNHLRYFTNLKEIISYSIFKGSYCLATRKGKQCRQYQNINYL